MFEDIFLKIVGWIIVVAVIILFIALVCLAVFLFKDLYIGR